MRVRRKKIEAPPRGPRVRRKRQKTEASSVCVLTTQEVSDAEDGGSERYRREVILKKLTAAVEAHPGTVPVRLDVYHVRVLTSERTLKTSILLEARIADTPEARASIEALTSRIESSKWIPT